MLDDPRSQALVDNFAGQWLYLRNVAAMKPDPVVFPEFDDSLRQSFEHETSLFFQSVLREDRSVTDLLDANYTFLNQRLAEHYGVPNIYGSQFRQVALNDPNRGGLLGQGSILLVTSYPNRTSVVQRGKWILENLLGTPPPPPPPDIPDLEPTARTATSSPCASRWSSTAPMPSAPPVMRGWTRWASPSKTTTASANGAPRTPASTIDPSGKLPDGTVFSGPAGLKKALLTDHRDEFLSTFTAKLLTYALGRGLEYYDQPAIRAIDRGGCNRELSNSRHW